MAFGLADTHFPVHDAFELSQEIVEIFFNNGWWKKWLNGFRRSEIAILDEFSEVKRYKILIYNF